MLRNFFFREAEKHANNSFHFSLKMGGYGTYTTIQPLYETKNFVIFSVSHLKKLSIGFQETMQQYRNFNAARLVAPSVTSVGSSVRVSSEVINASSATELRTEDIIAFAEDLENDEDEDADLARAAEVEEGLVDKKSKKAYTGRINQCVQRIRDQERYQSCLDGDRLKVPYNLVCITAWLGYVIQPDNTGAVCSISNFAGHISALKWYHRTNRPGEQMDQAIYLKMKDLLDGFKRDVAHRKLNGHMKTKEGIVIVIYIMYNLSRVG